MLRAVMALAVVARALDTVAVLFAGVAVVLLGVVAVFVGLAAVVDEVTAVIGAVAALVGDVVALAGVVTPLESPRHTLASSVLVGVLQGPIGRKSKVSKPPRLPRGRAPQCALQYGADLS